MNVRIRRTARGYVGQLAIPVDGANAIEVSGWADSIAGSLRKASSIAARIASDPIMASLLPPGSAAAIEAARRLSKAAERGAPALRAQLRELRGPGARRLARVLAREVPRAPVARAARAAQAAIAPIVEPITSNDDGADLYGADA